MSLTCESIQNELTFYWYGELDEAAEARVDRHLAGCAACSREFETWKQAFATMEAGTPEPSGLLLDECRAELGQSLRLAAPAPVGNSFTQWLRQISSGFVVRPLPAFVGACAMAVFGYYGAQWSRPVQSTTPEQMGATHVRYVLPGENGMIRLVVEETRERELAGRPDDPSIRGLLVRAAQDSADPSVRVETVEMLNRDSEVSDVRDTLMEVLEHDQNPGVRLKAIEGLKAYASEEPVRRALSSTLLRDQDTTVRMQAIDTLMKMRSPETVGVLQEVVRGEANDYIRQRSLRALQEMNASAGTF